MTHKVTQHRKMEVRHGRAITKQRWGLIRAYMEKREHYWREKAIGPHTHWGRYADWANDFERFMICGGCRETGKNVPTARSRSKAQVRRNGSGLCEPPAWDVAPHSGWRGRV